MPGPEGLTRRSLLGRAGAAAAALYAFQPPPLGAQAAAGWADADYWAFADRAQALLDPLWWAGGSAYAGPRGGLTSLNANMLFTHAAAARAGHTGPARQDARARRLIARLCASPPWLENEPGSADP